MSRIGKKPVKVPAGVNVSVAGNTVKVEGPKGKLSWSHSSSVAVAVENSQVTVTRKGEERQFRALHGTTRALINNMIKGVSQGFEKRLRIVGVGWGAKQEGGTIVLSIGFNAPVKCPTPAGVKVEIPNAQQIILSGPDKQVVGQYAAEIRKVRPPEPYKQKGIRYEDEVVRKKAGKSFVSGGA